MLRLCIYYFAISRISLIISILPALSTRVMIHYLPRFFRVLPRCGPSRCFAVFAADMPTSALTMPTSTIRHCRWFPLSRWRRALQVSPGANLASEATKRIGFEHGYRQTIFMSAKDWGQRASAAPFSLPSRQCRGDWDDMRADFTVDADWVFAASSSTRYAWYQRSIITLWLISFRCRWTARPPLSWLRVDAALCCRVAQGNGQFILLLLTATSRFTTREAWWLRLTPAARLFCQRDFTTQRYVYACGDWWRRWRRYSLNAEAARLAFHFGFTILRRLHMPAGEILEHHTTWTYTICKQ